MPELDPAQVPGTDADDLIALSALNHFLYCSRRCALIHIEGVFIENAFTVEGQLLHSEADTPGYESRPGIRVVRALPVYSHRLGLSGRADIVEFHGELPFPVEYKRGKRKKWDNDDVQLCAQALCLEEMFAAKVPHGAIFHAATRRRRDVEFTKSLRELTLQTISQVRSMIQKQSVPLPVLKPQCEGCSLHPICMPELQTLNMNLAHRRLYEPELSLGD